MLFNLLILAAILLLFSGYATAHCPLCTAGAAAAAAGAMYLGVAKPVLGLFIGAFAVSMGLWFANRAPKNYVPRQKPVLIIASFLLTVVPVLPVIGQKKAFYIGLAGSYGTLLNNTYMYDASLATAVVGGAIVTFSPKISRKITEVRGEHVDYQGIIVTLSTLIALGVVLQAYLVL